MPNSMTLSHFDRVVAAAVLILIVAIALTIGIGDRVGVTLSRVAPLGTGHATSPIVITFSEAMDQTTVESRLRTEPSVPGAITWNGQTVTLRPEQALAPGTAYRVTLEAGALGTSGRAVLSAYQYEFTVASLRVAYLFPADGSPQNIWIADPATPDAAQQITQSPTGIFDFAVSPDGTRIAFTEYNALEQRYDLKMLTLANGALQQLTNCADADCKAPVWSPNGRQIAYERAELNTDLQSVGLSPPRIWLIDLESTPATTRPLFNETQILGYAAQWDADGGRIALFDRSSVATLVYDLTDGRILAVPNTSGSPGVLSPDGTLLAYTELILLDGGGSRSILKITDLEGGSVRELTSVDQQISDTRAQWSPDGTVLAVARQDPAVMRSTQIFLIDPTSGEERLLTEDPRYANAFFWYDPTGTQLVIQRFPELGENMEPDPLARPEIWIMDVATGEGVLVASNGYLPRWVP